MGWLANGGDQGKWWWWWWSATLNWEGPGGKPCKPPVHKTFGWLASRARLRAAASTLTKLSELLVMKPSTTVYRHYCHLLRHELPHILCFFIVFCSENQSLNLAFHKIYFDGEESTAGNLHNLRTDCKNSHLQLNNYFIYFLLRMMEITLLRAWLLGNWIIARKKRVQSAFRDCRSVLLPCSQCAGDPISSSMHSPAFPRDICNIILLSM